MEQVSKIRLVMAAAGWLVLGRSLMAYLRRRQDPALPRNRQADCAWKVFAAGMALAALAVGGLWATDGTVLPKSILLLAFVVLGIGLVVIVAGLCMIGWASAPSGTQ